MPLKYIGDENNKIGVDNSKALRIFGYNEYLKSNFNSDSIFLGSTKFKSILFLLIK